MHRNQVSHVLSPIFAKSTLHMAKVQSAMFGVPNIQISHYDDWKG